MSERIKTITYLSPPGTFTEEAALVATQRTGASLLEATDTIPNALQLGEKGGRYVIVPLETTVGDVAPTLLALLQGRFSIRNEIHIQVRYAQFSIGEVTDREVNHYVTKPEAEGQCRRYLQQPGREHWQFLQEPTAIASTAAAVAYVARENNPEIIAFASPKTAVRLRDTGHISEAEYLRLVCTPGVGNSDIQYTKFVVLTKPNEGESPAPTGNDATSILVDIPDEPGSLDHLLESLGGLNMSAIKSLRRENGQATLFITLDGHIKDQCTSSALDLLPPVYNVRSLGSYPRDPLPKVELDQEPDITSLSNDMLKILSEAGYSNNTETAISFMLENRPGSLREVAKILRDLGVNITRLHSRPTGRFIGDYVFGITIDNSTIQDIHILIDQMHRHCTQASILSIQQNA